MLYLSLLVSSLWPVEQEEPRQRIQATRERQIEYLHANVDMRLKKVETRNPIFHPGFAMGIMRHEEQQSHTASFEDFCSWLAAGV